MDTQTHGCGGAILVGGSGEQAHRYCDRCHAYTYQVDDDDVPDGTIEAANRRAWDDGQQESPDRRESGLWRSGLIIPVAHALGSDTDLQWVELVVDQALRDDYRVSVRAIIEIAREAAADAAAAERDR